MQEFNEIIMAESQTVRAAVSSKPCIRIKKMDIHTDVFRTFQRSSVSVQHNIKQSSSASGDMVCCLFLTIFIAPIKPIKVKLLQLHMLCCVSAGGQGPPSAQLMNNDPEPWGFRGGLSGEFQVP